MATKATAQAVSLNLEKIADVAGKISIDDLKVKSPTELTSIKKMIPEFLIEKQLNESLGQLIRLKWGLTVQTFGAKAVLIAVQTPSTGTYSFTIYKKEQKLLLLKAAEKKALLKDAESREMKVLTEKITRVPAGYTLFQKATNVSGSLHLYLDTNVEEGGIYIYRLYTSATTYIEQTVKVANVTPTISSFTATPDKLNRKVVFNFSVNNATKIAIYKGTSTTPLSSTAEDTAVQHGTIYKYTLKATNDWGGSVTKQISVACTNLLPAKPTLNIARNTMYLKALLRWNVADNVSNISFRRTCTSTSGTRTFTAIYSTGTVVDSVSLQKDKTYSYVATVSNGWGSTAGNAVKVTMSGSAPAVPTIADITTNRSGHVVLKVSQVARAVGYRIYRTYENRETLLVSTTSIQYTDTSVTLNEPYSYRVSAYNVYGESAKSAYESIFAYPTGDNVIKRKALCVATTGNIRSPYSCQEMAKAFQHNGISAECIQDVSKAAFAEKLKTFFSGFDADDYPIVMFYAHGGVDSLSIFMENGRGVSTTYADLKKMLDKVPGHKILLISACHSGSAVSTKSLLTSDETFPVAEFAANIRKVFSVKAASTGTATKAATKSAELATDDYSVICSAARNKNSQGTDRYTYGTIPPYGYNPQWWCKGIGWNIVAVLEEAKACRHHADSNSNKAITVAELTDYTRRQEELAGRTSEPFCWPENDNKVILTYDTESVSGIRYFSLKNTGSFVVQVKVKYTNPSTGSLVTWSGSSASLPSGGTRTVDLSQIGIPAGVKVKLNVVVVSGGSATSSEYIYNPDSAKIVSFAVSGTVARPVLTLR